jgi:hypothetical protein
MPNPSQLDPRAVPSPRQEVHTAEVLDDATAIGQLVRCEIPAEEAPLATDPLGWSPVSTAAGIFYPKRGCKAQVSTPPDGPPRLITWEPKEGATPDAFVVGEPGPEGPKGATGATGPEGPKGATGATGPEGPKGSMGATGATGSIGPEGPVGKGVIFVRAATTEALASNSRSGNVLTASANGSLGAKDGVTLGVGEVLLVKNEATGANNGPYKVTAAGGAGSKWTLERIAEFDSSEEARSGTLILVAEGTQNGGVEFALLTTGTITLNTTALTFGYAGAWVEPTLLNSYANYTPSPGVFSKASYRRSRDGRVHIRGLVQHTGGLEAQKAIFQLPTGFRPALQEVFEGQGALNSAAYVGPVRIDVKANGEVIVVGAVASNVDYLSLSEISFYTD